MMLLANEKHSSAFIRGSARCTSVCVRAQVTGSVPRRDVKPLIRRMFSLSPFRDSLCSLPHYSRLFCLSPLSFPLSPRLSALLIARNRCKPACMYRDIHIYTRIFTHLSVGIVTSGDRYREPLICYEVERLLLSRPPTKTPFPSSLPPFCFCERVVSLPTDTRRIIRTASSLAWRFADCRFSLPSPAASPFLVFFASLYIW